MRRSFIRHLALHPPAQQAAHIKSCLLLTLHANTTLSKQDPRSRLTATHHSTPHHTQTTTTMTVTGVPQRHKMTMSRQLQAVRLPQPSAPSRPPPPEPHHWRHWRERERGGGDKSQAHAQLSCAAHAVPVCAHFAHTHPHLAHARITYCNIITRCSKAIPFFEKKASFIVNVFDGRPMNE
jgi:hypothetical protein